MTSSKEGKTPADLSISATLEKVQRVMDTTLKNASSSVLQDIAADHLKNHGRYFRARIALEAAKQLGVPFNQCVSLAAACELVHNASLIHDDIQDGDRERRGQPSLWVKYGVEQAISAGDLLLMLPTLALDLSSYGPGLKWQLCRCISKRSAATACGQALEHALTQSGEANREQYEQAALGKTGHLFAMPVEGAAILAGHEVSAAQAMGDAALKLGILFQIQDDLVDLYGDKGRGTPGSDLRVGKLSALVVMHLERVATDRQELLSLLTQTPDETPPEHIAAWARRMNEAGTINAVQRWSEELLLAISDDPRLQEAPSLRTYLVQVGLKMLKRAYDQLPNGPHPTPQILQINEKAAQHGSL